MTLFDTETREPIGNYEGPMGVWSLNFDPGGDSLAVAGSRGSTLHSAHVKILDAETARVRRSIPLGRRQPAGANLGAFVAVNYGPDGRSLIVTYSAGGVNTTDVFMRRFDARDGTPLGRGPSGSPRAP